MPAMAVPHPYRRSDTPPLPYAIPSSQCNGTVRPVYGSQPGILRVCTKYFQHTTNAGMQSRCGNHLRCYTKLADLTTIFFALVVGAL